MAAYEAITTRLSGYSADEIAKYAAVMYDANGAFDLADGTRPLAGIVEYGAEEAGIMITVVRGAFPAIGSEDIEKGDLLKIDASNPGKFKVAAATEAVAGVALTDAAAGDLFTVALTESAFTVPQA